MVKGRERRAAATAGLGIAYLLAVAGSVGLTRFDGGVAFLWIANAILTARLITLSPRNWPLPIAVCFVANAIVTATIGLGPTMAVPLGIANMSESIIGALLMHRFAARGASLGGHRNLVLFVLSGGLAAPLAGAIVAGTSSALILGSSFTTPALHWFTGHALGTLAFMPMAMLVMRGEARRLIARMGRAKVIELCGLLLFVTVVTLATFTQDEFPLLYLPMLPIILATFRGGPISTALSILILAVIGGWLTMQGHGPIALMNAPIGTRVLFLQLYVACAMLTVLPANAELERRADLFRRLRESEARYRLITEHSTDIVLNADPEGHLRFVSSSIRQIFGQEPAELIGQPFTVLLHPDDAARAMASFRRTIEDQGGTTINEYRAISPDGEVRWFETHSRAVIDDEGGVAGVVSAIRDVTHRRAHEERLARAALTDPLTGIMNRRGLDEELSARLASGAGGCVALFDLDHFKQVNDTFGHAVGDDVLRRFAAIARSSVRDQDIVARLGGEEFAVVLPEATIEQARLVCDRLRRAIGEARLRIDDQIVAVTVSGGVTRYAEGNSVSEVLRAADRALYQAKRSGRDQLTLAA